MVSESSFKQTEVGLIPEDWDFKKLGELGDVKMCKRIFQNQTSEYGDVPFFKIGTFGREPDAYISKKIFEEFKLKYSYPKKGDILISAAGTIGRTVIYNGEESYFQDSNIVWLANKGEIVSNALLKYILEVIKYNTEGGTIQRLYNSILRSTIFLCPPLPEQKAIAEALSDADAWIENLENLITKKNLIKQAAKQELLTPKEDWKVKKLGDIVQFGSGKDYKHLTYGDIPVYGTGGLMTMVSDYLYEGESVGIGRKGTIDNPIYLTGKFWTVDTLFYTHSFWGTIPKFIYYQFLQIPWKEYNEASGVPSLNKKTLEQIEISLPSLVEQTSIVNILSDIDKEIESLANKLIKARQIKQGMMQELLSGKTRLI